MTRRFADFERLIEGLDANETAVMARLFCYANAGGTCWPSHERLASDLKRSRQWVCRIMKRLAELGRVKITERKHEKGGQKSSVYSLPLSGVTGVPESDTAPPDRCNNLTPTGVTKTDTNLITHEPIETPTPAREGGVVVHLPMAQGWGPSAAVVQEALRLYPHLTDRDLDEHTAKFASRCRAKNYTYADYSSAWLSWLAEDQTKSRGKTNGQQFETAFERRQRSDQQLHDSIHETKARHLARWHARHGVS